MNPVKLVKFKTKDFLLYLSRKNRRKLIDRNKVNYNTMKKVPLILNIVLLLAVAALYVLHFTGKEKKGEAVEEMAGGAIPVINSSGIAFVNFDTILLNYNMFIDLREELASKQRSSEAELTAEGQKFEREAADFQDKVQKGLVTRSRAQEMQQQLIAEQDRLTQLRDDLSLELMEEEQVMNRQVLYSIMEFLEEYNKKHNYQYILSNTLGGALLYANDTLDITANVLKGLNEQYNKETEK
jgi:outer membrane protein